MDNGLLVRVVIETNISPLRRFKEASKKRSLSAQIEGQNVKTIKFVMALMLL